MINEKELRLLLTERFNQLQMARQYYPHDPLRQTAINTYLGAIDDLRVLLNTGRTDASLKSIDRACQAVLVEFSSPTPLSELPFC